MKLVVPCLIIQNSKPQESGKERVCVLITEFRNTCKEKIDGKKLGPREFEAGKSWFDIGSQNNAVKFYLCYSKIIKPTKLCNLPENYRH